MLNINELDEIIKTIIQEIIKANRSGNLEELLTNWGFANLVKNQAYETDKKGKIVVIGQTDVNKHILEGIVKSLDLDVDRFEFCLDYNETARYEYKKLQYAPDYRVVMFGPIPHSSSGKNDSSSVIAEMKNNDGYPRVETLVSNNELKITKSGFRKTLEKLISENYI